MLREEGVSFQAINTFKVSNDPDFETKKNRILELYDLADGKVEPGPGDPTVVICMDKFGPLNLQPYPGRQWAPVAAGRGDPGAPRRRRMRATSFTRPHGIRHLLAAYDLSTDRLYGHVKIRKGRTEFLAFCRCIRSLHPPEGAPSRSCSTTSAHTWRPRPTPASATGLRPTMSSWPTHRSTGHGSTGSKPNSRRCGTSPPAVSDERG